MVSVKQTLIHLLVAASLALSVVGYTVVSQHLSNAVPQIFADETAGGTAG